MYNFMVCILVYLNYFYCKDIPFIVKRKENIGIFTLSLQYSNFEIPIKMEIDLTTPALLFSAISLIMLAYTNRFLSYAQLVRTLKDQYRENHSAVTAAQIANLRKRLYLTRAMQVTGIGSLLLCVVSMFLMYIQFYLISVFWTGACAAHYFFGDFCARDLYFGQGAGIASKRYGFLIYFFEKIFIIKEQVASVIPVPTTPCHPNQCQNIPARSVPMEPPIK